MTYRRDFSDELSGFDKERLAKASVDLWASANEWPGVARYSFYRRKGHSVSDSIAYAIAWCLNTAEQAARRFSHETGADRKGRR